MKSWKTLLFGITMITNTGCAELQIIDKISAVVGNDVILESDVDSLIQSIKMNTNQVSQQFPDNKTLRHQVLERLILDQIILQIGQKMGFKVTDKQLNQIITNIAKQNNMTIYQMINYLAYNGIRYDSYRNQIRKKIIISEVRNNEVRRRITILSQEVDALAKQISNQNSVNTKLNLSYILVLIPENPTYDQIIEAENQAHFIFNQARNGSDFSKLAITYSTNQQKLKYVQIGWGSIQELPSIFAPTLITAKKDDIIGPIHSEAGFYILKVNNIRDRNHNIFINEVNVRHILLKPSLTMTDAQVRMKLQQISADIKSGKISFANAAKKFSQDLDSANQGGELGWAEINTYNLAFRNALMKLNKNQISAPVHSSLGWHLIELLDIRRVDKTNVVHKDRAYSKLFNHKFSEEAVIWMQEQRASTYVKILSN